MTKDMLIMCAVIALVAIMLLAALPEITSAMPEVYYVEPTEPETATEAEPTTVLQSTASVRYALTAAARPEPSDEVKKAVAKVFDDGETATDREILYFYAPALCQSLWHESQTYVCTIGGHRFFEEAAK